MKFSFFSMPLHLPNENPSLAFKRDMDLIKLADDLGYDGFFVGEHHTAAWENIPSPEIFLSKEYHKKKVKNKFAIDVNMEI